MPSLGSLHAPVSTADRRETFREGGTLAAEGEAAFSSADSGASSSPPPPLTRMVHNSDVAATQHRNSIAERRGLPAVGGTQGSGSIQQNAEGNSGRTCSEGGNSGLAGGSGMNANGSGVASGGGHVHASDSAASPSSASSCGRPVGPDAFSPPQSSTAPHLHLLPLQPPSSSSDFGLGPSPLATAGALCDGGLVAGASAAGSVDAETERASGADLVTPTATPAANTAAPSTPRGPHNTIVRRRVEGARALAARTRAEQNFSSTTSCSASLSTAAAASSSVAALLSPSAAAADSLLFFGGALSPTAAAALAIEREGKGAGSGGLHPSGNDGFAFAAGTAGNGAAAANGGGGGGADGPAIVHVVCNEEGSHLIIASAAEEEVSSILENEAPHVAAPPAPAAPAGFGASLSGSSGMPIPRPPAGPRLSASLGLGGGGSGGGALGGSASQQSAAALGSASLVGSSSPAPRRSHCTTAPPPLPAMVGSNTFAEEGRMGVNGGPSTAVYADADVDVLANVTPLITYVSVPHPSADRVGASSVGGVRVASPRGSNSGSNSSPSSDVRLGEAVGMVAGAEGALPIASSPAAAAAKNAFAGAADTDGEDPLGWSRGQPRGATASYTHSHSRSQSQSQSHSSGGGGGGVGGAVCHIEGSPSPAAVGLYSMFSMDSGVPERDDSPARGGGLGLRQVPALGVSASEDDGRGGQAFSPAPVPYRTTFAGGEEGRPYPLPPPPPSSSLMRGTASPLFRSPATQQRAAPQRSISPSFLMGRGATAPYQQHHQQLSLQSPSSGESPTCSRSPTAPAPHPPFGGFSAVASSSIVSMSPTGGGREQTHPFSPHNHHQSGRGASPATARHQHQHYPHPSSFSFLSLGKASGAGYLASSSSQQHNHHHHHHSSPNGGGRSGLPPHIHQLASLGPFPSNSGAFDASQLQSYGAGGPSGGLLMRVLPVASGDAGGATATPQRAHGRGGTVVGGRGGGGGGTQQRLSPGGTNHNPQPRYPLYHHHHHRNDVVSIDEHSIANIPTVPNAVRFAALYQGMPSGGGMMSIVSASYSARGCPMRGRGAVDDDDDDGEEEVDGDGAEWEWESYEEWEEVVAYGEGEGERDVGSPSGAVCVVRGFANGPVAAAHGLLDGGGVPDLAFGGAGDSAASASRGVLSLHVETPSPTRPTCSTLGAADDGSGGPHRRPTRAFADGGGATPSTRGAPTDQSTQNLHSHPSTQPPRPNGLVLVRVPAGELSIGLEDCGALGSVGGPAAPSNVTCAPSAIHAVGTVASDGDALAEAAALKSTAAPYRRDTAPAVFAAVPSANAFHPPLLQPVSTCIGSTAEAATATVAAPPFSSNNNTDKTDQPFVGGVPTAGGVCNDPLLVPNTRRLVRRVRRVRKERATNATMRRQQGSPSVGSDDADVNGGGVEKKASGLLHSRSAFASSTPLGLPLAALPNGGGLPSASTVFSPDGGVLAGLHVCIGSNSGDITTAAMDGGGPSVAGMGGLYFSSNSGQRSEGEAQLTSALLERPSPSSPYANANGGSVLAGRGRPSPPPAPMHQSSPGAALSESAAPVGFASLLPQPSAGVALGPPLVFTTVGGGLSQSGEVNSRGAFFPSGALPSGIGAVGSGSVVAPAAGASQQSFSPFGGVAAIPSGDVQGHILPAVPVPATPLSSVFNTPMVHHTQYPLP